MKGKAFTLIELLIVITIIAIIAAILFPVFATAREKARQSSCASNEKQIGIAFSQYLQDYDEYFPSGMGQVCCNYTTNNLNAWVSQIYPYIKSDRVFVCLSAHTAPGGGTIPENYGTYGMNSDLGMQGRSGGYYYNIPLSISQLSAPAVTVSVFEALGAELAPSTTAAQGPMWVTGVNGNGLNGWNVVGGLQFASGNPPNVCTQKSQPGGYVTGVFSNVIVTDYTSSTNQFCSQTGAHSDGANYLFADWHVKWLKPSVVSAGLTNTASGADCGNGPSASSTLTAATTSAVGGAACAYASSLAATFSAK